MSEQLDDRLTKSYWPGPKASASADREAGNAAVDQLTLAELKVFFSGERVGPTYCLVREHINNFIDLVRRDENWFQRKNNLVSSLREFCRDVQAVITECEGKETA